MKAERTRDVIREEKRERSKWKQGHRSRKAGRREGGGRAKHKHRENTKTREQGEERDTGTQGGHMRRKREKGETEQVNNDTRL